MSIELEDKRQIAFERQLRRRCSIPKGRCVLRRVSDGKFLGVLGWSVEWEDQVSSLLPVFTPQNLGKLRESDFHKSLWVKFTVLPRIKHLQCQEMLCAPHYLDEQRK
jgi:hypothetical protein